MTDRDPTNDGLGFLSGSSHDPFAAPGKRTPTSRLPGRDPATASPPELLPGAAPVADDDPFALHLERKPEEG